MVDLLLAKTTPIVAAMKFCQQFYVVLKHIDDPDLLNSYLCSGGEYIFDISLLSRRAPCYYTYRGDDEGRTQTCNEFSQLKGCDITVNNSSVQVLESEAGHVLLHLKLFVTVSQPPLPSMYGSHDVIVRIHYMQYTITYSKLVLRDEFVSHAKC